MTLSLKQRMLPAMLAMTVLCPFALAVVQGTNEWVKTGIITDITYNAAGQATSFHIKDDKCNWNYNIEPASDAMTKLLQRLKDKGLKATADGTDDATIGDDDTDSITEA